MNYEQTAKLILKGDLTPSEDQLFSILMAASDSYYNEDESFLTDAEFDALERMLATINPNHQFLAEVGSEVRGGKIKLPITMGSLDQVYEGELEKWIRDNKWNNEAFIVTDKQDGISGLIVYGPGLKIAYSRGNGQFGADITRHIKKIASAPKRTDKPCTVRVEIILPIAEFKKLQPLIMSRSGKPYKNPRNMTAGCMNSSEASQAFYDAVQVILTSVESPELSKVEQIEFSESNNFITTRNETYWGNELDDDMLKKLLDKHRKESKTEIDGLVVELDSVEIRKSLTRKGSSLNPTYARKFKVGDASNVAITKVVKVHYEASKTGYLKPRVQVEPVDLVGVTIQFATGFNAAFIKNNGIGPGAEIQITRSGDVIPFIQKVIKPVEPQLPSEKEFGTMSWNETEVDLVLDNPEDNDDVQLNKLNETFRALEIPALREGSIKALYEAGYKTAADIITCDKSVFREIIGAVQGDKIYNGIQQKLNPIPLGILAGASQMFGRGIGRRKMTKLVEAVGDLNSLTVSKIAAVEGFDVKTAEKIIKNLPAFETFLQEIDGYYTLEEKQKVESGALEGLVVVFTGVRDKALEAAIESKGGTIGSSINAKTTHLVAKDPNGTSGKLKKAADLGLKPISLEEAHKLWL